MSSRPRLATLAAKVLSPSPEEATPVAKDDRERAIGRIADAIHRRHVRRARLRWAAVALAGAAACVALAATGISWSRGGSARSQRSSPSQIATSVVAPSTNEAKRPAVLAWSLTGHVSVTVNGRSAPLEESRSMGNGDRVEVREDARAALILATGTRLTIEAGSEVTVVEGGPTHVFSLVGATRADVAKLGAGERFIVRTADAEVEVRGTSFRVSTVAPDTACGGGITTRVAVFEGIVVVRAKDAVDAVGPGESWPKGCALPSETPPRVGPSASSGSLRATRPVSPLAASSSSARAREDREVVPAPGAANDRARSDLTSQNDLFAEAMAAKRRGDVAGAVDSYEKLLARYPRSTLAESAAAERMRLLAQIDRSRATAAAKDYLGRYPSGFARADAERILGPSP
jgi:hypothetical protein